MAKQRHLRNAPIVEAVVDFRVVLPPDFNPERLREAREHLSREYPKMTEIKRFAAKLEFTAGGASQSAEDLGIQGVLAKTDDEKTQVQFRVDGFTLNRVKPYTSWKEIGPEALRLWNAYSSLTNPQGVTRVALRYINHMAIPASSDRVEDFILTGPRIPEGIPKELSGFATRAAFEDAKRGLAANVLQMFGPDTEIPGPTGQPPGYALLLDIDAYKTGDLATGEKGFDAILSDLHSYKNEIFFGSLTDAFAETFE